MLKCNMYIQGRLVTSVMDFDTTNEFILKLSGVYTLSKGTCFSWVLITKK